MKTIATHSGSFHADDVLGVAILLALLPGAKLIRTRDPLLIARADFAVDVGGEWDPDRGRFDHHQKGFDGARASGVTYASAGLVWLAYGKAYLRTMLGVSATSEAIGWLHTELDRELMQHLDMADTGAAQGAAGFFGLSALVSAFNLTRLAHPRVAQGLHDGQGGWAEEQRLSCFLDAVKIVQTLLIKVVRTKHDEFQGAELVRAGQHLAGGRILLLEHSGLAWIPVVCNEMPEVRFVIYPDSDGAGQYQVRTVPVSPESFQARLDLPAAWAGLRDHALATITGVGDAVFCHNGRFIAGAGSQAGALRLAELALASSGLH